MRRALGLAAVLVLSGCGSGEAEPEPAWFADRQTLPSCDAVVLDQGDVVPDTSSRCLLEGSTDSGAELVVRSPTTEGDPVYTYYRPLTDAAGSVGGPTGQDSALRGPGPSVRLAIGGLSRSSSTPT